MRFKTSFAQTADAAPAENARAAVRAIHADCAEVKPAFVVFYASTDYDPDVLAAEMRDAFPGALTLGCTTAGEACGADMRKASVVAMAFSGEVFSFCETAIVLDDGAAVKTANAAGDEYVFADAGAALDYLGRNLGKPLVELDYRKYLCFMLGDRISPFTEAVVERAGEKMNAFLVGGIAGDDYKFSDMQAVFYQGKAYKKGAAVLALWKPKAGFEVLKTQAVELTDKQFTITKADEENRIIWELDGRNAVEAYAEAIGVDPAAMDIGNFDEYPLSLVANGEPFLRALVKQIDGGGLQLFARIREGMRFTVTRAGDIRKRTEEDFTAKIRETGKPAAVLHVNCASRYMMIGSAKQTDAYGKIFDEYPHIAFASYGEIYISLVAMTSVMILFK